MTSLLDRFSIQSKLILASFLLILSVYGTLYGITREYYVHVSAKTQFDYDMHSFEQANQFITSIIQNNESKLSGFSGGTSLRKFYGEYHSGTDLDAIDTFRRIDTEIKNTFTKKDYVDAVLIMGRNGVISFSNLSDENKAGSSYFAADFDFSGFETYAYGSGSGTRQRSNPSFFQANDTTSALFLNHTNLFRFLSDKLITMKIMIDSQSRPTAIIMTVYGSPIITNIFPVEQAHENLLLLNNMGKILWSKGEIGKIDPDNWKGPNGFAVHRHLTGAVLTTYSTLAALDTKIVRQFPLEMITAFNKKYTRFSLIWLIIAMIISVILSRLLVSLINKPLNGLASQMKDIRTQLPVSPPKLNIFFHQLSLRNKWIAYFLVTVLLPSLSFMMYSGFFQYESLKQELIKLTNLSQSQTKTNIDYRLYSFDELTVQLLAHEGVQQLLYGAKNGFDPQAADLFTLYRFVLDAKSYQPNLLSIRLYTNEGNIVFSSSTFDDGLSPDQEKGSLTRLENSGGQLSYLSSSAETGDNAVSLVFVRQIRSLGLEFGKTIGYAVISTKADLLSPTLQGASSTRIGDTFVLDPGLKLIYSDTDAIGSSLLDSVNTRKALTNQMGFQILPLNRETYLAFSNRSELLDFPIVSIVSQDKVIKKVLPLLQFYLLLMVLIAFFTFLLSSFISISVTRPFKRLQKHMDEMNKGNLNVLMSYDGKDEVGILVHQFNIMIRRLNELIFENYQSKLRESELMFLEKEAQLNALQQQINPHFLYNTLESIRWMAFMKGNTDIVNMTVALGKFFRGNIIRGKDLILLQDELTHLESYLYIQQIRYKGKFEVRVEVADKIKGCKIIKLILQPLIENAITHGVEMKKEGGIITLKGYEKNGFIHLEIRDNGAGIEEAMLLELRESLVLANVQRESIGLANVYKRLQLFYQNDFVFSIESDGLDLGTVVHLSIPFVSDLSEDDDLPGSR